MNNGLNDRKYWLDTMLKIATPVLTALSNDELRKLMPVETATGRQDRKNCTHLEAIARCLCGIAPWLECKGASGKEEELRQEYALLARKAISVGVNPSSKDFLNFSKDYQPIVDAGFLAHAFLRANTELWEKLDEETKKNVIVAMKSTRTRKPCYTNWLLFSAIIETFLYKIGENDFDLMRIDYAIRKHDEWYKGDGMYGDGKDFSFDYYNSFVIQPMLVDVVTTMAEVDKDCERMKDKIIKRARRYSAILERLIAPDGTFPVIGRSMCYRFGCFQHLSQMALQERLDEGIGYSQVRCALTSVIKRIMAMPNNFDENGWLKIGLCTSQPSLGEPYISTGSNYLCSTVFLPLGLSPEHPFWSDTDQPWTAVKAWGGEDVACDHSIN